MRRLFLLGSIIVGLQAMSLATSVDYASKGSIGAGTASLSGSATGGSSLSLSSPLTAVNSVLASGTVTVTTGALTATSNPNVFSFVGGSLTIQSGGSTLFHGVFSSGSVKILGPSAFTIVGLLNGVAVTETDMHGDVQGDTLMTPEPETVQLIATGMGLIGIAAVMKHRKQRLSENQQRQMFASRVA